MSFNSDTVSSEQLGHLGLVAATIRELGIIERIDARLDLNERKGGIVSHGRRVAAMVKRLLLAINQEQSYDLFYKILVVQADMLEINDVL